MTPHPFLEQLKTAVHGASSGPWVSHGVYVDNSTGDLIAEATPEDARFISLANPLAVGKLVEALKISLHWLNMRKAYHEPPQQADVEAVLHVLSSIPTKKEQ